MSNTLGMDDSLYHYYLNMTVTETEAQIALRKKTETILKDTRVAPEQGQFIAFLIRLLGVKTIVEIGASTGYSTLSMAQALPERGKIICCDNNKEQISIGQAFWEQAGVESKIELHIAPVLETLKHFISLEQYNQIDLVFINGDKKHYPQYIEQALQLLRQDGVMLLGNVFWEGKIAEDQFDEEAEILRQVNQDLAKKSQVFYTLLPIANGLGIALKKSS